MTNLQFAETFCRIFDIKHKQYVNFKPHDYQKEILNAFDGNRNINILSARQTGISTILAIHIARFLIYNDSKLNRIVFKSDSLPHSKNVLKNVITFLNSDEIDDSSNSFISMKNGNEFLLLSEIVLGTGNINTVIIDNAAFIGNLEQILNTLNDSKPRLVMASAKYNKHNHFEKLFNTNINDLNFKITFEMNPVFDAEWRKNRIELIGENAFKSEY